MKRILRLLAIDPGDRWCGFAGLTQRRSTFYARCGVLDRSQRESIVDITDELIGDVELDTVICESYQMRMQGFNLYNAGQTAQLIGALEYRARSHALDWSLIPPGNPGDLERLILGEYVHRWRGYWKSPRASIWNHALSAWAVMGRYLIREHQDVLSDLIVKPDPILELIPTASSRSSSGDLIAPVIQWEIP